MSSLKDPEGFKAKVVAKEEAERDAQAAGNQGAGLKWNVA